MVRYGASVHLRQILDLYSYSCEQPSDDEKGEYFNSMNVKYYVVQRY